MSDFHPFKDMKESAKMQHEIDKAQFEAVKAESKANREEAKALGRTDTRKAMMRQAHDEATAETAARKAEGEARIQAAKANRK